MINLSKILFLSIFLFSCGITKYNIDKVSKNVSNEVEFYGRFLKDKGSSFVMGLSAISINKYPILIKKKDIICGRGDKEGTILKYQKIRGPFLVVMPNNGAFTYFNIVCEIDSGSDGDFYVGFKKIFKGKKGRIYTDIIIGENIKVKFNPYKN